MLTRRFATEAIVLALLIVSSPTQGAIITFEFSGEVTFVQDYEGILGGKVSVGDSFAGTYTFDSTMPDTWPDDPNYGRYYSGASGMTFSVGDLELIAPGPNCAISIANRDNMDGFSIFAGGFASDGIQITELPLNLYDTTASVFSDDSLPLTHPNINSFDQRTINVQGVALDNSNVRFRIEGVPISLTPEPDTILLLLLFGTLLVKHKPSRANKAW